MPGFDPGAGDQLVDHRRADRRARLEVELLDALVAREAGVVDAAGGTPAIPVVALGHHQFADETEVGQLLALCGGGDLFEIADGGHPQHPLPDGTRATFARDFGGCPALIGLRDTRQADLKPLGRGSVLVGSNPTPSAECPPLSALQTL